MRTLLLLSLLLLSACGTTRQLDAFKDMHERGQFAELARQTVDCPMPGLACSQMHELKANACLHEGRREAAPGGALRAAPPLFSCAVRSYDYALVALPGGHAPDAARLRTGLLAALREWRDHGGDVRVMNERMIREAAALRPASPAIADFWEATGRFGRAMTGRGAARCRDLAAATRLLGETPADAVAESREGLRRAVAAESGGCR